MPKKTEWPKLPKLPSKVAERLAKCLALVPDRKVKAENAPCVMGGKPPLPKGMAWPSRDGKLFHYLGRVDTHAAHELMDEVPDLGWLLFFHDDDTDRLQTVIVARELGEPLSPPGDSEYITQSNGPESGEVSKPLVCRLEPSWSWGYDSNEDLDDDLADALDELKPENSVGQLMGLPAFELEYAQEHAMQVAAGFGKVRDSFKRLSKQEISELRSKLNQGAGTSDEPVFACPKLTGRLKSMVESLKVSESEWSRRAAEKGRKLPDKFAGASKRMREKQGVTVEAAARGEKMEIGRFIEMFAAWDAVILELERAKHDKKHSWLFDCSKELRASQQQVGKLSLEEKKQRQEKAKEEDISGLLEMFGGAGIAKELEAMVVQSGVRDKLHMRIVDRLMDFNRGKRNLLDDVKWAMAELEAIGDRIDFSDVTFVLNHAARVLHNHKCVSYNSPESLTLDELDALEACLAWNRGLGKEGFTKAAKQWRLLFSFDSELDYCWSDSGSVRYFIEADRLAMGDFGRVVADVSSG